MQNFIDRVEELNNDPNVLPDPSPEAWAARAFSIVSILGNHVAIDEELGEALAILVARAPISVMADGTLNILINNVTQPPKDN
jgi:hypothetical protein